MIKREPILHTASGNKLNVTWVGATTQKGKQMTRSYERSEKDDLFKAYKKPSTYKVVAFNDIKKEMERVGGYEMKITGAGCDFFSCAYKVKDGSDSEYIVYHTPTYRYCVFYSLPW